VVSRGPGWVTWARGQQLNRVKALRQEYSGGHRDSSGQMLSSSSVSDDRTIQNDCGEESRRGQRKGRLSAGNMETNTTKRGLLSVNIDIALL